jgi:(p)ppGpp synthase/HD superfamily hydrolase
MTATVEDARTLATAAHRGQVDKAGQPYINHPAAVAAMLGEHGDNAVMAGWLHDTVEDTEVSLDQLRKMGFPDEVVQAVDAVTRREGETYMEFVTRAAKDPLGRQVKLADNAHNSDPVRLAALGEEAARGMARRYERARKVLLAE